MAGCYWDINMFNSTSPVFFHDITAVLAHNAFAVCGEEIKLQLMPLLWLRVNPPLDVVHLPA